MSIRVIVHETRRDGGTLMRSSDFVEFKVGDDTPLRDFIDPCRSVAAKI